ncbi:MAG: hypothetical protein QMC73_16190 [Myxococcota bacterium]
MRAILVVVVMVWTLAGEAGPVDASTLQFSHGGKDLTSINASYGNVQNVGIAGPALAGATYDNASLQQVEYELSGGLSTNPSAQSGVPNFVLKRTSPGEGIIPPAKLVFKGSSIAFGNDIRADLFDGFQLNELVADETGLILEVNVREFERLDRARYHPPRWQPSGNETARLQASINSSDSASTPTAGTVELGEADVGENTTTVQVVDISGTPIVTSKSGTGALLSVGLALFAYRRRRSSERDSG